MTSTGSSPTPPRRRSRLPRTRTLASISIAGLVLVAACGSDDDGASGTATTGADRTTTTAGSEPTTTAATPTAGQEVLGTWQADAGAILAANTSNIGGLPGSLSCSGPIAMTLAEDGTLTRSGNLACSLGPSQATGSIATTASWRVEAPDRLIVTDATTGGEINVAGQVMPFPDSFGDGEATYSVQGDTLEITFSDPAVGTVTQTYTRA